MGDASDMHAAAYLLYPRFYHLILDLVGDKELTQGLRRIIIKLTTSAEAAFEAWHQFKQTYARSPGDSGTEQFKKAAESEAIAPHEVWDEWGEVTELQAVAVRALAVFPQATSCERIWKDLSCTHTAVRNRLSKTRAEKLVYVKGNRLALEQARMLPEEQYNWVGADIKAEIDDSDGESVEYFIFEGGMDSEDEDDDELPDYMIEEVMHRF
jgi:hypothetical protein